MTNLISNISNAGYRTPEGGEIFNDYENNIAYGKGSFTTGLNNISGTKALIINKAVREAKGNNTYDYFYLTNGATEENISEIQKIVDAKGLYSLWLTTTDNGGNSFCDSIGTVLGVTINNEILEKEYTNIPCYNENLNVGRKYTISSVGIDDDGLTGTVSLIDTETGGGGSLYIRYVPQMNSHEPEKKFTDWELLRKSKYLIINRYTYDTIMGWNESTYDSINFTLVYEEANPKLKIQVTEIRVQDYAMTPEEETLWVNNELSYADKNRFPSYIHFPANPHIGTTILPGGAFVSGFDNKALIKGAIVAGAGNTADGAYSAVFGRNNYGIFGSLTSGRNNSARGMMNVTLGERNNTSGWGNIALGNDNILTHDHAKALGGNLKSSSASQILLGVNNAEVPEAILIVGNGSNENNRSNALEVKKNGTLKTKGLQIGQDTEVTGSNGFAQGWKTKANGNTSGAFGYDSNADGFASFVQGSCLSATGNRQTVVGSFNVEDDDAYFIVGNGDGSDRATGTLSNAFVSKKDGSAIVKGKITANNVNLNDAITTLQSKTSNLTTSVNNNKTIINYSVDKINELSQLAIGVKELPEEGNIKNVYVAPDSNYVYMARKYPSMQNAHIWSGTFDPMVGDADFERVPDEVVGFAVEAYYIEKPEQLAYFVNNPNIFKTDSEHRIILKNDIFLNDIYKIDWETGSVIKPTSEEDGGDASDIFNPYTPNSWYDWDNTAITLPDNFTFDGNGHTIYGLYRKYDGDYAKTIYKGCSLLPPSKDSGSVTIKDLRISMSYIKHPSISSAFLAYTNNSLGNLTFENCGIEDDVYISAYYPGGFVGVTTYNLSLTDCYSLAHCDSNGVHKKADGGNDQTDKSNGSFLGNIWGISGETTTTTIIRCYTTADYFGYGGRVRDHHIGTNSYNKSTITDNDISNMQGVDALTNLSKMPLLADYFVAEYGYPICKPLAYGWHQLNSSNAVSREEFDALVNSINAILATVVDGSVD